MKETVLYVHGKGGSAAESAHYAPLFPGCGVVGVEYRADTPWEAGKEIRRAIEGSVPPGSRATLIAVSIGAYFCMNAGIEARVKKAYFISPIVDMVALIGAMMRAANVTEAELEKRGVIPTADGNALSWEYLCYAREHPAAWRVPTHVLYGENDHLTQLDAMRAFTGERGATLTVMPGGEHWFHTAEQMRFLDGWIRENERSTP